MKKIRFDIIAIFTLPIIIGSVVAVKTFANAQILLDLDSLLVEMSTILATLFGFVLTAMSILLTFEGNERTKRVRDSRHYGKILLCFIITNVVMLISMSVFFGAHALKVLNEMVSFIFVALSCICFIYLLLVLIYFIIVILTVVVEPLRPH